MWAERRIWRYFGFWRWRKRSWAKEYRQTLDAEKGKERSSWLEKARNGFSPRISGSSTVLADTLVLAPRICQTSGLRNCKRINLCVFKSPSLCDFVTAALGNQMALWPETWWSGINWICVLYINATELEFWYFIWKVCICNAQGVGLYFPSTHYLCQVLVSRMHESLKKKWDAFLLFSKFQNSSNSNGSSQTLCFQHSEKGQLLENILDFFHGLLKFRWS